MLKKLSFLVSMPFMGFLLIIFIVVLALATFIESSYGTSAAWAVIYGTHWFEVLLLLVGINVAGTVIRFRTFNREKITVFVFHLSFALILIGAGITRFISYEGWMHIREGESSSHMTSNDVWLKVTLRTGHHTATDMKPARLSELTPKRYRARMKVGDERVTIRSTGFISNAVEQYVPVPGGKPFVQLVALSDRRMPLGIPSGESGKLFGMDISFNKTDSSAILRLFSEGDALYGFASTRVTAVKMGDTFAVTYEPDDTIPFVQGTLYSFGHFSIALQGFLPSAGVQFVRAPEQGGGALPDAVRLEITYRGMVSEQFVAGTGRVTGIPVSGTMGDLEYAITYGSKEIPIPFELVLREFRVERYPGSNSPSSFASEVVLLDAKMGIEEERRIYMNNVLKHRGYRFYQSSYDTDEKGSVLSVNKDRWGTSVTYAGYILLIAGMFLSLFRRGTRFSRLAGFSAGMKTKGAGMMIIFLLFSGSGIFAQPLVPPKRVASEFGKLWVQGKEGRFKPMNTLSDEVTRKVTGKSGYQKYTPDQVLLGMVLYPEAWQNQPLFRVKHPELQSIFGYKGEYLSFNDFFNGSGSGYLLYNSVNSAYAKEAALRDDLDKEVIRLDDRINAMYLVQSGSLLRIFPSEKTENNRWYSVSEVLSGDAEEADSAGVVFLNYLDQVQAGNYATASDCLNMIAGYQEKFPDMVPEAGKKRVEMLYNRIHIFPRLGRFYGIFGLTLLVLQFIRTFRHSKTAGYLFRIGVIHLVVAFCLHTLAFFARWYISGHAPLSNGYESMIFVSWAFLLAGLIFMKSSGFAIGITASLASLSLIVANMSWMNPEITNLVPVLQSVWLTIHVTVVMAGYGFLGLASFLGLIALVFFAILNHRNRDKIAEVIQQLTRVNHMTLIIGLYFMTAGVFLGGVWANESWGRYWGWDPKETWALITVLVFAFVAHMHHIPGLRGNYAFNLASFFAFSSVLMTYFGVNYFLGGIHSYAGGSPFALPWYFYALVLALIGLSVMAYYRQERFPEVKKGSF